MAATTAANLLKPEENKAACTMLLSVKGFAIAVPQEQRARAMERRTRCVRLWLPQAPTGVLWDKEFAFEGLAQCVWLLITPPVNRKAQFPL